MAVMQGLETNYESRQIVRKIIHSGSQKTFASIGVAYVLIQTYCKGIGYRSTISKVSEDS
jgi:hypothetical protein